MNAERRNSDLLVYHGVLAQNRDVFLINHADIFSAFNRIDRSFAHLLGSVQTGRDGNDKTHISLIPFLVLMQRQIRAGFECASTFQTYQSWVLMRVAIEIPLIIGKWVDAPANVDIWKNRESDPKPYRREFQGKKFRSRSLPQSAAIQSVLRRVNDRFVHANDGYYSRHIKLTPIDDGQVGISIEYFDDMDTAEVHMLAMIHLIVTIQESLHSLFNSLLGNLEVPSMGLSSLQETFSGRVLELAAGNATNRKVLEDLGLWELGAE